MCPKCVQQDNLPLTTTRVETIIISTLKKSKIYSADIFPDLYLYKSNRIENFFIDNSKKEDLEALVNEGNRKLHRTPLLITR